ncbi:hypothetical protein AKO1_004229 [Acrasis kona]|uniref:G domain-containing protein n=1 Tax=Acrasis kona TaxID=1008807 RepID=A0AAW2Z6Z4_9EUKA
MENGFPSTGAVPGSNLLVEATDVLYEVMVRKGFIFNSSFSHLQHLRDVRGGPSSPEEVDARVQQEGGWRWLQNGFHNQGSDSWEYARGLTHFTDERHWGTSGTTLDHAKRRKLIRKRVKLVSQQEYERLVQDSQTHSYTVRIVQGAKLNDRIKELKQQLEQGKTQITQDTRKPNILLLGGSGAGKSSLVNAVFGKTLAEIGEGKPVTQQYTKFSGNDSPVTIYDSKGIEHGYIETGFVADTRKFFSKLRKGEKTEHVHVVWYVIDLTQARFQPFEANFCQKELEKIPIIFVFNKADAVGENVTNVMMQTVRDFKLPHCMGMYATVANQKNFDSKTCPACNSTKIKKRLKQGSCTIVCKECAHNVTLEKTRGIEQLSRGTLDVLPDLVKQVYVHSLNSGLLAYELHAKEYISDFAQNCSMTKSEHVSKQLELLTVKLCEMYELNEAAPSLWSIVKKRFELYYDDNNWSKKAGVFISDFFSSSLTKKATQGQALVVVTGINVCRCLFSIRTQMVDELTYQDDTHQDEALAIHHIIESNMSTINIDGELVNIVSEQITIHGSVKDYLLRIPLDKSIHYIPFVTQSLRVEDDEEPMTVPLYSYQQLSELHQQNGTNGAQTLPIETLVAQQNGSAPQSLNVEPVTATTTTSTSTAL